MIIVSDTSCISNLQIIGKLDILHSIYSPDSISQIKSVNQNRIAFYFMKRYSELNFENFSI